MSSIAGNDSAYYVVVGVIPMIVDAPSFATPIFRQENGDQEFIQSSKDGRSIDEFVQVPHLRRTDTDFIPSLKNKNFFVHDAFHIAFVSINKNIIIIPRDESKDYFFERFEVYSEYPFLQWTIARVCASIDFIDRLSDKSVAKLVEGLIFSSISRNFDLITRSKMISRREINRMVANKNDSLFTAYYYDESLYKRLLEKQDMVVFSTHNQPDLFDNINYIKKSRKSLALRWSSDKTGIFSPDMTINFHGKQLRSLLRKYFTSVVVEPI